MDLKTFPLRLTGEKHIQIKEAAYTQRESMHEYILKAIEQRIQKEKVGD
jgi:predicted HicB family RNase H-like nuclease